MKNDSLFDIMANALNPKLLQQMNQEQKPTPTPLTFDQLQEGKVYTLTSHQFKAVNKARLISLNTKPWPRKISYWQYTERGFKPTSKEKLIKDFKSGDYDTTVFALWDFELEDKITVTEIE